MERVGVRNISSLHVYITAPVRGAAWQPTSRRKVRSTVGLREPQSQAAGIYDIQRDKKRWLIIRSLVSNKEIQVSVLGDCLDHRHGYPDQFWSRRARFHTFSAHNLLLSNVSSRYINIYSFPFRRNARSSRIVNILVYVRCKYFFDI